MMKTVGIAYITGKKMSVGFVITQSQIVLGVILNTKNPADISRKETQRSHDSIKAEKKFKIFYKKGFTFMSKGSMIVL